MPSWDLKKSSNTEMSLLKCHLEISKSPPTQKWAFSSFSQMEYPHTFKISNFSKNIRHPGTPARQSWYSWGWPFSNFSEEGARSFYTNTEFDRFIAILARGFVANSAFFSIFQNLPDYLAYFFEIWQLQIVLYLQNFDEFNFHDPVTQYSCQNPSDNSTARLIHSGRKGPNWACQDLPNSGWINVSVKATTNAETLKR